MRKRGGEERSEEQRSGRSMDALAPRPISYSRSTSNRVHQVFLNADLRFMLPGLLGLCKKNFIKVKDLSPGELVVFINTGRNYIKILAGNNSDNPILACYRLASGRIVDLNVVSEIPKAFMGNQLDYDAALKMALDKYISSHPVKSGRRALTIQEAQTLKSKKG